MENQELKTKLVTPLGDFNCQAYPIDSDNCYAITDEELEKLGNHELKWEYENVEEEIDDLSKPIYSEEHEVIGYQKKTITIRKPVLVEYDNTSDLAREQALHRIQELKTLLKETDYRAIKYAEGQYTEEEYAPYKALRQSYRDEINELEGSLEGNDLW